VKMVSSCSPAATPLSSSESVVEVSRTPAAPASPSSSSERAPGFTPAAPSFTTAG
jgi:hypothetical protein